MSEGELPKSEEENSLQASSKEEVAKTEGLDSEESEPSSFPLPKSVRQFIQSFSMTMGPGFPALGIMEKLKDEHITQFFDHVEAESKREAADRTSLEKIRVCNTRVYGPCGVWFYSLYR